MSAYSGPEISEDGLVLFLDAFNVKSYDNTTKWFDLSGKNNTATMIGTVPVITDGGACFDFSTVTGANAPNASLGFTFASDMIPTTGSFTLSCWIKNPNSTGQVGMFSNSGSGNGYRFGITASNIYWLIGPTYAEGSISFLSSLNTEKWYNVTCVFDRSGTFHSGTPYIDLYLNGEFQNSAIPNASQTAFTPVAPGLVKSACCTLYKGKLSQFSAYNRALSADEIKKNFNATRGRYGI